VASLGFNNGVKGAKMRLRELAKQFAPLEAATGLTAEEERQGAFAVELRHQLQTQHGAASKRDGREPARSRWRQQSAFLHPRH
jgi:hypothetical protein